MINNDLEAIAHEVIGSMIEVHKKLGPGFLENVYHRALEIELKSQKIYFESEKEIELYYNSQVIGVHRLDLLIENQLIVELKTVEVISKKHYSQVRSYLKSTNLKLALLVNFSDYTLDPRRVLL